MKKGERIVAAFARHTESTLAISRRAFYTQPEFTPIDPYDKVLKIFREVKTPSQVPAAVEKAKQPMQDLQPLLTAYQALGPDDNAPIVVGEDIRAQKIGAALQKRIEEHFGTYIRDMSESPTVRTRQTAKAMRAGMTTWNLPSHIDSDLRERRSSEPVNRMVYRSLFLITHPNEWVKYIQQKRDYRDPGIGTESENQFVDRVRRNLRALQLNTADGVHLGVTHSGFMREVNRQLGGEDEHIKTGSVMIIKQKRQTPLEFILQKPGKLAIEEIINPDPYQEKVQ